MKYQDSFQATDPRTMLRAAADFGAVRVLLHSADLRPGEPSVSILAFDPVEQIDRYRPQELERKLASSGDSPWERAFFGYFSYELLSACEPSVRPARRVVLAMPEMWLARFRRLLVWDHDAERMDYFADSRLKAPAWLKRLSALQLNAPPPPPVARLHSLMPASLYVAKVRRLLDEIYKGTIFQANLTRKFAGRFAAVPAYESLYAALSDSAPAPYSAYMETPFGAVLSCSPELFLQMKPDGLMRTRPIKGSAGRGVTPEQDDALLACLSASVKNRAENLMIADLARNDLARSCTPGSVKAEYLCKPERFRNVHHLVSSVTGMRRPEVTPLRAMMNAFPPGSMTGAPKVQAMRLISEYEPFRRGVYSGALGVLRSDGGADFSVVIRTLVARGAVFECQTGGGVVADSDPFEELDETAVKLRGLGQGLRASELFRRTALR